MPCLDGFTNLKEMSSSILPWALPEKLEVLISPLTSSVYALPSHQVCRLVESTRALPGQETTVLEKIRTNPEVIPQVQPKISHIQNHMAPI